MQIFVTQNFFSFQKVSFLKSFNESFTPTFVYYSSDIEIYIRNQYVKQLELNLNKSLIVLKIYIISKKN
jgi:hypothetical protein